MLFNIELEDAQELILKYIKPLAGESVPIIKALGRINYRDIWADSDLPGYKQAARDGFAVCLEEASEEIFFTVRKSEAGDYKLKKGEAVFAATGKKIPDNTTAVIPLEQVEVCKEGIKVKGKIKPGNYIKLPGEDFCRGECLITGGLALAPGMISLLAAYGYDKVMVYKRPRVAILSLTPQIIPYDQNPSSNESRDSNGPLLNSLVLSEMGIPISVETVYGKRLEEVRSLIINLLEQSDLLLTTGGTFAAGNQEVRLLLEEIGAEILFMGIPVQPGGHNGAAVWRSKLILSLSGNPAACAVGFHLLAAPVLRKMQGINPHLPRVNAVCNNSLPKTQDSRRFIRGYACCSEKGWRVNVLPGQKPGMIRSLLDYNCLIDLPAGHSSLEKGSQVSLLLINHTY